MTPDHSGGRPSPAVGSDQGETTYQIIEDAVLGLWNVVDELSRVHPPKAGPYRVTIFGSARIAAGDPTYLAARMLAAELARMGCDIVTGGGPGLMQAANEGERSGDANNMTTSYGLRVDLAFEQTANPFVDKIFRHRTFFSRLHHFVRLSSAFVVVDGGIGTALETMMVWQLLQVRHLHGTPFILVGPMWRELVKWVEERMVARKLCDPIDATIPTCVDSVEEAVALIRADKAQRDAANKSS